MKVRHTSTGVEFEVKKPLHPQLYYLTKGGSMIHVNDPAFELVPEEGWEDVTGNCRAYGWNWPKSHPSHEDDGAFYLSHNGVVIGNASYRLRKIEGLHHGPAFIVERKKEP